MDYHMTDAYGVSEIAPDISRIKELIDSVYDSDDADMVDVSLVHGNGYSLSFYASGNILLEKEGELNRVFKVSNKLEAIEIFKLLAEGDIKALSKIAWEPVP